MMLHLEAHPDGAVLPVKAHASGRKNALAGEHVGALKVSVTQAPEKGKANKAIADVLCKALSLKRSQVELLSGATVANKRFLIRGISLAQLAAQIEAANANAQ